MKKIKKSKSPHRVSKKTFLGKSGNVLIIGGIILIFVILAGLHYFLKQLNNQKITQPFVATFAECTKLKGSVIIDTYPKLCKTEDKVTYIEEIKEPIDISSWTTFSEIPGVTFKCPPSWQCTKFKDDSASINQSHYLSLNLSFQIYLITSENFQKGFIRHPGYDNPISWYNDLQLKKQAAIQAPISTRIYRPGSDGYSDPLYANYDFSKMERLKTDVGEGLIFPGTESNPDTTILIPLNNSDLILVLFSPGYFYKDPIIKGILTSIRP
jgi:hypothetical protein